MAGHLLLLFPIFELVALQKRTKIYLVLRKLGLNERMYWLSVIIVCLVLALVSNLFGTLMLTLVISRYDTYWTYMSPIAWFLMQFTASISIMSFSIFYSSFISQKGVVAFIVVEFMISYLFWAPFGAYNAGLQQEYETSWVIKDILGSRVQIFHTSGYEIGIMTAYALKAITNTVEIAKTTNTDIQSFGIINLFISMFKNVPVDDSTSDFIKGMQANSPLSSLILLWATSLLRVFVAYLLNKIGFGIKEFTGNLFDRNKRTKKDDSTIKNFKITGLEKNYGGSKKALKDFSIEFEIGNIYAILGLNGAGKSTLFNCLMGLTTASDGTAILFGNDILADNMKIRELAGVCHQQDILFDNMDAKEHFQLYCDFRGVDLETLGGIHKYTLGMLQKVGLEKAIGQRISEYSGGMQRRLSLVLATVGNPSLYFLDEPTAGLDPLSKKLVWKLIEELKQGAIVLLTSHDMEEADKLASKVIIMSQGEKIAFGSPLVLKNEFAKGLRLTLSKRDRNSKISSVNIIDWVQAGLPFAKFISGTDESINFGIPKESIQVLGEFLDIVKQDNLLSWSVGNSTLEEVFFNSISLQYEQVSGLDVNLGKLESLHTFETSVAHDIEILPEATKIKSSVHSQPWTQISSQLYKMKTWLYNDFVVMIAFWMIYFYFFYETVKIIQQGISKSGPTASAIKLILIPLPFVTSVIKKNLSNGLIEYQVANGVISWYFWLSLMLFFTIFSQLITIISIVITSVLVSGFNLESLLLIPLTSTAILGLAMFIGVVSSHSALISWIIVCFTGYGRDFTSKWFSVFPSIGIFKYIIALGDNNKDLWTHFYLSLGGSLTLLIIGLAAYYFRIEMGKGLASKLNCRKSSSLEEKIDMVEIDSGVKREIEMIGNNPSDNEAYRLCHLSKNFGLKQVVDDLSLRLLKNETMGLLGVSGAGKTTTIAMIVNLAKPSSGYIEFVDKSDTKAGYCPQQDSFFDFLSVEQHLRYYSALNGISGSKMENWISTVASRALLDKIMLQKFPEQLSGGMKRRVTFAISLASGRKNLILDEPTVLSIK